MSVISWEDPPIDQSGRVWGWTGQMLELLMSRPNEWAILLEVPTVERSTAHVHSSNLRRTSAAKGQKVEAMVRSSNGVTKLYARYVGPLS